MGSKHPNIAPYGDVFKTADGLQLILAVGTDKQFAEICSILKIDNTLLETFKSNGFRVANRPELIILLQKAISTQSSKHLRTQLLDGNIPFGFIKNIAEVLHDQRSADMISENPDGLKTGVKNVAFYKIN